VPKNRKEGAKMKVIGIDIGGTKSGITLAGCTGDSVEFFDKTGFPTEGSPDAVMEKLVCGVRSVLKKHGIAACDIAAAGINCGGPLDTKTGTILCPPNLPDWINIPAVSYFESALGIPCFLQNDANAGAIAEHLFGAGKGFDNIIFLTHGTGMGAGFILDGRLYSGTNDMAGEVGHLRLERFGPVGFGKAGSFEGFCSGGGVARLAQTMAMEKLQTGGTVQFCRSLAQLPDITAKTVADAAKNGDALARQVFNISGKYLGRALALLIDILNPQRILLGSIYGRCKEFLQDSMMHEIEKEALSFSRRVCEIRECGLGESINDYEAVSIAVYALRNQGK
jgi:glucokinase